jgi:hypothetical protein
MVFLYENGKGIIAYGKGSGQTLIKSVDGYKDECYYQILDGFTKLQTPLKASEIKKILDRRVIFLNTLSSIPEGQKLLDYIDTNNI